MRWVPPGAHIVAAVATISLGTAAYAENVQTLDVTSKYRGKSVILAPKLYLPDKRGDRKIPAMVIVHGSGGVRAARELAYAKEFEALGIAAVVIDSFTPRGIKSTVRNQGVISARDMLVDAANTLKAVARHPAVDPARIGVIGFSKGGSVVVRAALRHYLAPLHVNDAAFSVLIARYPWCGDQPLDFHPANGGTLHMLLGDKDRYVGTESCQEFGKKFAQEGGNRTLKIYPQAQHGWDVPGSTHWSDRAGQNFRKCVYDEIKSGTWIERSSRIVVLENYKSTGNFKKAVAHCMTLGVSGGYNKQARQESLQDIRGYLRAAFHLQ
jgi:dienelactone hydrolase